MDVFLRYIRVWEAYIFFFWEGGGGLYLEGLTYVRVPTYLQW